MSCPSPLSDPAATRDVHVSVLIVAYHSEDLIEECLRAIAPACQRYRFEILLVDNADGGTAELVEQQFPEVRIVPGIGNVGFAAGNNLLAQHAVGAYLLLLNPDMMLSPGAIDALLDSRDKFPRAAAWGGITIDAKGGPDAGNAIAMPSLGEMVSVALGRSRIGSAASRTLEQDAQVDVLVGGLVMFSRSAWDEASGLDERYFLYSEEVDLFARLAKLGYTFWRIPAAGGRHLTSHGNHLSPMRLLYRAAGSVEFVRSHWSWPAAQIAKALIWVAAFERFVAGRLLGRWKPHLRRLGDGYRFVALHPRYWVSGYDRRRGLMARLAKKPLA